MAGYDSKYSGAQVEALLDQVASGNAGGGGGGGIAVETDPLFANSPAATITEEKIAEWDAKSEQGEKGDKGDTGVGVQSVAQTTTSNADGGSNVVTVTLTNGAKSTFTVKNGSKGSQGLQGEQGPKGDTGETGVQGPKGDKGDDGATFTPSVDSAGNLSWSNDKGLANPPTVNIKGPKGDAGSGGGSTSIKPYVLQAVALSELEVLGVGEQTLYFRDYQKAGEDLTALQNAAIGDGLVALNYPYDESAMGYIFPTSVRLGSEEYGAEVQFYINGATFTLYYPTAPSDTYSDITVSVLRQGEKEVVRVDNGGGVTNDIYDMRPNVIYAPVFCNSLIIHNFLPAQVTEERMYAYDVFTAILALDNSIIDENPPQLTIVDNINWVNGEFPELTEGLWELSIARFTEWVGEDLDPYTEYFGVLTPFKPIV